MGSAALQVDPNIIFPIFNLVILDVVIIFNLETSYGFFSAKLAPLSAAR
jgi:hypothetical protein